MRRAEDLLIALYGAVLLALVVGDAVRTSGGLATVLLALAVGSLLGAGLTLAVLASSGRVAERLARSPLLPLVPLAPVLPLVARFARFHATTRVPAWWVVAIALGALASRLAFRRRTPALAFALTGGVLLASGMVVWLV